MTATTATDTPAPTLAAAPEQQRLGATLTLSVLVHVLLIAGVGFTVTGPAALVPTLDVIFSQAATELTPAQADFLAASNNQGGGEHDQSKRPREAQPGLLPRLSPGEAAVPEQARTAPPRPAPQARVVTSRNGTQTVAPTQTNPSPDTPDPEARQAERERRHAEMARLAAEVHLRSENYAKRPTRKFVSASTKEYAYASYLRAWVDRAERVGNLNYPDQARQRRLGGQVVISVGVRQDGSVESARVLRSSGVPLLDDAALRIVQLAAPFPPLPATNDGVDILYVTRTWNFLPEGDLRDADR